MSQTTQQSSSPGSHRVRAFIAFIIAGIMLLEFIYLYIPLLPSSRNTYHFYLYTLFSVLSPLKAQLETMIQTDPSFPSEYRTDEYIRLLDRLIHRSYFVLVALHLRCPPLGYWKMHRSYIEVAKFYIRYFKTAKHYVQDPLDPNVEAECMFLLYEIDRLNNELYLEDPLTGIVPLPY